MLIIVETDCILTAFEFILVFFRQSKQIIYRFLFSLFFAAKQILTANINTYSEVENALQPIIMAQKVRIYPYSQYDRTVCLRAELIGCIWDGEFCFGFEQQKAQTQEKPHEKKWPMLISDDTCTQENVWGWKLFHVFV